MDEPLFMYKAIKRKPEKFDLPRDAHYEISQISNVFRTKHALIPLSTTSSNTSSQWLIPIPTLCIQNNTE